MNIQALIEAWPVGFTVRIGSGRFDLGTRTLAEAVRLARSDRRVRTVWLPLVDCPAAY